VLVKKKLREQLGFHRYTVNTHPDEFIPEPPSKNTLNPPMTSPDLLRLVSPFRPSLFHIKRFIQCRIKVTRGSAAFQERGALN